MQRDAHALSEHTPGVEPVSDRRKWRSLLTQRKQRTAVCQKHLSCGHERLFGFASRLVLSNRHERDFAHM